MLNIRPIQKTALLIFTLRFSFAVGSQAQPPAVLQLNLGNTYNE